MTQLNIVRAVSRVINDADNNVDETFIFEALLCEINEEDSFNEPN